MRDVLRKTTFLINRVSFNEFPTFFFLHAQMLCARPSNVLISVIGQVILRYVLHCWCHDVSVLILSKMTRHLALGSTKQAILEVSLMKVRELPEE